MRKSHLCIGVLLVLCVTGTIGVLGSSSTQTATNGDVIIELMTKQDAEAIIGAIEAMRGVRLDASTRGKMQEDWGRIQDKHGRFTGTHLVEIARATDQLERETWVLTSSTYVLKVQFVFYLGAKRGPQLVCFRYDQDFYDMPWTPTTNR